MTDSRLNALLLAGCVSLVAVGAAGAGGFSRGSANLDGLYGTGEIGLYSGITYVSPGRSYENARGVVFDSMSPGPPIAGTRFFSQDDIEFGGDYVVPYASVGGRVVGDVSCVGSYAQPYGADSEYSGDITFHVAEETLETHEYGLTCAYGFDLAKGRLSIIGGGFVETVEYGQARNFETAFGAAVVTDDSRIDVESDDVGYRLGVGYEIPEIALKAQLMYRSQTDHDAEGDYSNTPFPQLAFAQGRDPTPYFGFDSASATASASLPQSLELSVQSGIAPGWLAFASVKWTDWSVLKQIQLVEGIDGAAFSTTRFFFEDGWTVTGGVGHKFNDKLGGSLSLTWDKGVTSGWDALTDTWTVAGGVAYDVNDKVQIRAGGAAIYITDGEKSKTSSIADFTASAPSEWGYALSAVASVKF